MSKVYINSIKQISAQQPLVDNWIEQPVFYSEPYIRAIEPDYKLFFTSNEARRLGKILKRALVVSRQAMLESEVISLDAIITSTGLGCIENTEIFLDKLVREGEELLNPTHFMQSTHNTISSLIAIDVKCKLYNSTYAHKGISFECALQDAFIQLKTNKAQNVLVGAHDEMTPAYYTLLKKAGYFGNKNQKFASETAVAMILSTDKSEKTLCEIEAVEKLYNSNAETLYATFLQATDIDYIMVGCNGDAETDKIYFENCAKLFPNIPLLQYKNIFGESYTVPALGVYAAAICLQHNKIPDFLTCDMRNSMCDKSQIPNPISKILCYNHFEGKNHTFVLIKK